MSKKPVLLCIMDGFGWTPNETYGNAVVAAKKPYLDALMAKYPMTTIEASGIGCRPARWSDGQLGSRPHQHGCRPRRLPAAHPHHQIHPGWRDAQEPGPGQERWRAAIDAGKAIHLMGLVGTGGVHSHADHWFGVLEMAKHMGAKEVYLHCITDGRDTDPHSWQAASWPTCRLSWMSWASARSPAFPAVTTPWIVTTTGTAKKRLTPRSFMARATTLPTHRRPLRHPIAADKTDEFVLPCVTCEGGRVQDGDTVIFMNFRPDRARQMTRIFCDDRVHGL